MLYILEKLKKLEIPYNSLTELEKHSEQTFKKDNNNNTEISENSILPKQNPYLNGKKGHLIYLFPLLTKCITCKEPEVKVLLKELFDEISIELDLNKFYN